MKRSAPPRSRKPIARKTRVKPVNRARKDKNFARCYHSEARVQFVKSLPCAICGVRGYSENAHTQGSEGMARKGSYLTIAPLCSAHPVGSKISLGCHRRWDTDADFRAKFAEYIAHACLFVEERWQRHQEGK